MRHPFLFGFIVSSMASGAGRSGPRPPGAVLCALLVAFLAVLRRGHSLHGVKGLGKYQGITVSAGQCNTLDRIIRGVQKFSRLGNTEGSKELLGRHPQIVLEQRI